jgi:hypothetical protein
MKTIRRILFCSFLTVILAFVGCGVVGYLKLKQETPPSAVEAPWLVETSSRIYYASKYSLQDGQPAINGYWTLDDKKFTYHNDILVLDKALYGVVKVVGRFTMPEVGGLK